MSESRARLPVATDLPAQIGAALARGQPLVLMVTMAGCGYCDIVRRHYLAPLNLAGELVAAQIELRGQRQVRAPGGRSMRESELVQQWRVATVPTLLFLGPRGDELAPRLVGYSEHFYGGHLDEAIATARQRLALR